MLSLIAIPIQAQTINQEIVLDGETPFLLGKINKNGLTSRHYNEWFSKNHEDYTLDEPIIEALSSRLNEYTITLFMGTWCGDSKLEVPHFYKILEACDFPEEQLSVVALSGKPNMYKQSPTNEQVGLNIHRVPTFIFYKDGKEVNRIVEHPIETLEKDVLNIITTKDYKSHYQIVTKVNAILKEDGLNGLKKQRPALVKSYNGKVDSMFELNTYGRVLYGTNRKDEAIEVFRLNNLLFPDEPRTYMSLANTLGVHGNSSEAIRVMENAIQLFPDNEDLTENLTALKTR